jgi:hypothetical protein
MADFFGFFGALKRDFFGVHPKKVAFAPMTDEIKSAPTCTSDAKEASDFFGVQAKKVRRAPGASKKSPPAPGFASPEGGTADRKNPPRQQIFSIPAKLVGFAIVNWIWLGKIRVGRATRESSKALPEWFVVAKRPSLKPRPSR